MNKRINKKAAKRFLDTGALMRCEILSLEEYRDGNYYVEEIVLRRERLRLAIYSEAKRRGWDGNHWDNPLVVSVCEA